MKPPTRKLIETLLRHAQGMLAAIGLWLKETATD
jgi:hypothetical protein